MKNKKITILIIILLVLIVSSILVIYNVRNVRQDNYVQYLSFANLTSEDTRKYLNTQLTDNEQIKEIVTKLKNGENLYKIELNENEVTKTKKATIMYYEMSEGLDGASVIKQNSVVLFGLIPDLNYITMSYRNNDNYSSNYDCIRDTYNYMYKKDDLSYYLTHQTRFDEEIVNNNLPKFYVPDRILYNDAKNNGIYIFTSEDKCFDELVNKLYHQEGYMQKSVVNYEEANEDENNILNVTKPTIAIDYYQEEQDNITIKTARYFNLENEDLKELLDKEINSKEAFKKENSKELEENFEIENIPEEYKEKLIEKNDGAIYEARLTNKRELKEFEKAFKIDLNTDYKEGTTIIVTISKYKVNNIDWSIHKLEYNLSSLSKKYNIKVFIADEIVNIKHLIYKTNLNHYIKGTVKKIDKDTILVESGLEYVKSMYDTTTYESVNVIVDENTTIKNIAESNYDITFLDIKEGDQVTVKSTKLADGKENTIIADSIEVVKEYSLEKAKEILKNKTYLNGSIISINVDNSGVGEIVLSAVATDNISVAVKINVTKDTKLDYLSDTKLEQEKINYYSITTVEFDSKIGDYETNIPTAKVIDVYDG